MRISELVRLAAATLLAIGATWAATPALAAEGDTTIFGGPGGGGFLDRCQDGWVLKGLNYTSGKDLNSIGTVCAPLVNGHVQDTVKGQGTWGKPAESKQVGLFSIRPITSSVWCPSDMAVQGIWVALGAGVVHTFSLKCRNLITYETSRVGPAQTDGGVAGNAEDRDCGGGAIAIGVIGRSGSMVDALGLHCLVTATAPLSPAQKPIKKVGKAKKPDSTSRPGGGGADDTAVAPNGTTIYHQPNGDESEDNIADYVDAGGTVTVISCDGNFCHVSRPTEGYVWHADIGR